MNMILSILLCMAMLCSGGASIPAQPETATTWTLRNLTIACGDETVTLAPEARLTAAIGSEAAQLHFEIVNGDDVLMPMSGEVTADGARFSLGSNGNVYAITDDTLTELMDLHEDDQRALDLFIDLIDSYGAFLNRAMNDATFQREASDAIIAALVKACASTLQETEVEIGGATYPAQSFHLELTATSTVDLLEAMADCGVAEVDALMQDYILLFGTLGGEFYGSVADLAAALREQLAEEDDDISIPIDMTYLNQDGMLYYAMNVAFDQDGSAVHMDMESASTGEEITLDMTMSIADDTTQIIYALSEQVTGPANAPEKVHMDLDMSFQNHYAYEYTDEGATHTSERNMTTDMTMTLDAAVADGLESASIATSSVRTFDWMSDGENLYGHTSSTTSIITSQDRLEDDGSVTAAVAMDIDTDGEPMHISFDVNRAEGAPVDYFAGVQARELTADTGDAVYGQLATEALSIGADAMTLAADDSVIALTQMLGFSLDGDCDDYVVDTDCDAESDADYDDDYGSDIATVNSFEEAAEIYTGALPDYTAPEGYALESIEVDPTFFCAKFSSDEDGFAIIGYGASFDSDFYTLEDGALQAVDGTFISLTRCDGGKVAAANVYHDEDFWRFTFDDVDFEQAQAILAGLNGWVPWNHPAA